MDKEDLSDIDFNQILIVVMAFLGVVFLIVALFLVFIYFEICVSEAKIRKAEKRESKHHHHQKNDKDRDQKKSQQPPPSSLYMQSSTQASSVMTSKTL